MPSYNHTILMGHLTRDPEKRMTTEGKPVVRFTVAVNRPRSKDHEGEEEVLFMPCVSFGKTAEVAGEYLSKGDPVHLVGRLRENKWEKDGQKRSRIELVVGSVQLLKSRGNGANEKTGDQPEEDAVDESDIPF